MSRNYEGEIENDLPNGRGKLTICYQNKKEVYIGNFKNGMEHGYGTCTTYILNPCQDQTKKGSVKKKVFSGIWKNGKMNEWMKNTRFYVNGRIRNFKYRFINGKHGMVKEIK